MRRFEGRQSAFIQTTRRLFPHHRLSFGVREREKERERKREREREGSLLFAGVKYREEIQ